MNGWLILIALTAAVGAALWRFGRFPQGSVELLAAALLLAVGGYAWQGSPGLTGRPPPPRADTLRPASDFAMLRDALFGGATEDERTLAAADALQTRGQDLEAIQMLRSALAGRSDSVELWVGLGNALVVHGDGMVTPAAALAFGRAAQLSPRHPAPPFFLGLAYAKSGQLAQARTLWARLLAQTPMDAPWRADVALRLRAIDDALSGRPM
ncbi:cytochrome C biogenesis protein [Sphingomonas aliaeris]|uniref:Cytochrome C biogenesis protein n=1 Tax=Sphingomonas aliaeris TaxID=2759526 RepID=A0A974S4P7_9SPHN|nr:cytochrome C biogenesis protein [Sphingomonas aliaeris]QQV77679.1 cytochrome C biogenesis protein [Sphingomonas aliaeris]